MGGRPAAEHWPRAARRGIPVVLYCVSLGPVDTPAGRECLTRVLHSASKIITRETVSIDLARELHPRGPRPVLAADCALSVLPAPLDEVHELLRSLDFPEPRRPLLGFNVGVLSGKQAPFGTEHFERVVAQALDRAVRELEVNVLMVETQPLDLPVASGVLRRMTEASHAGLASHPSLGHAQLTGLLGQVEAFVGMRTHALILASSMHTPVSGVVAYPKTRGYLQSIGREDGMLELSQFSPETLWSLIGEIWRGRDSLRVRLAADVERERDRAVKAAAQLSSWLGPPRPVTRSSGLALLRESAGKRPRS